MKGEHVHILEKDPIPGGACDGYKYDIGYVMRGGRFSSSAKTSRSFSKRS